MTTTTEQSKYGNTERGVAILTITILLLLVATIGTVVIGRVGMMEQKVVGADVRNKEVYSAAIGGLEFGVDWIGDATNWQSTVWSDADGDGDAERFDTLTTNPTLSETDLNADKYRHQITYTLLTDMNSDVRGVPVIIRVDSVVTGGGDAQSGDTHVTKRVSREVMWGKVHTFAGNSDPTGSGTFSGPPILIEGCTDASNTITGQPDIVYNHPTNIGVDPNSIAVGTTGGWIDYDGDGDVDVDDLNQCIDIDDIDGHLNLCNDDGDCDDADDFIAAGGEFRGGQPGAPTTLWASIFGDLTEGDLRVLEAANPSHVLIVDSTYPHYQSQPSWNGNTWHADLPSGFNGPPGANDEPVILYFDESVGCPPINGNTEVYGLVYFEKVDCGNQGWGGGVVYGTVAKSGDLSKFNANAAVINWDLDFSGGDSDGGTTPGNEIGDGIWRFSEIPGSWNDYTEPGP